MPRYQHVNVNEAIQIHKDLRSQVSMAIHCCTFCLTLEPMDEPPKVLSEKMVSFVEDAWSMFWSMLRLPIQSKYISAVYMIHCFIFVRIFNKPRIFLSSSGLPTKINWTMASLSCSLMCPVDFGHRHQKIHQLSFSLYDMEKLLLWRTERWWTDQIPCLSQLPWNNKLKM